MLLEDFSRFIRFEQKNQICVRLFISWKIMKGFTVFIALILMISLVLAQETSPTQIVNTGQIEVLPQHMDLDPHTSNNQQPAKSGQSIQNGQQSNKQIQTVHNQNIQINSQNQTKPAIQVHSIPPEQYKSLPNQNNHHQTQHNTTDQHFLHSRQASPGLALHTLSGQQKQQMLRQQQLLDQHSIHDNKADIWKYANYTQEQLLQLQKKWQDQSKEAYQNALKQMEQRQKREREDLQKMVAKEKLTRTQEISHRQTLQFRDRQNRFNPRIQFQGKTTHYRHHFNDYMFELNQAEFEDFQISLVVAQTIALHSATYSNNNGLYTRSTEIDNQVPPELQVFEDGKNLITNQIFYFKKFITFQGKANTRYLIRMNNPGKSRLFSLSVVQLVDESQISHALTQSDLSTHGQRAARLYEQLRQNFQIKNSLGVMAISNQQKLNTGINHYYYYNILQLILVIGACLVQVKYIQKLLSESSIV